MPRIADGPKKSKKDRDFWDDFEELDLDSEDDDFNK